MQEEKDVCTEKKRNVLYFPKLILLNTFIYSYTTCWLLQTKARELLGSYPAGTPGQTDRSTLITSAERVVDIYTFTKVQTTNTSTKGHGSVDHRLQRPEDDHWSINFITPPQDGREAKVWAPILTKSCWCWATCKLLVRMSASWSVVGTYSGLITRWFTLSLVKWQSTSTCLVRSWWTGFTAMARAAWLSHLSVTGAVDFVPSSSSN